MKNTSKKTDPFVYTFAVGKIRALENLLLKDADFQQLINLDFYEAIKFLSRNRYYGEKFLRLNSSEEIESFLDEKERDLESLIAKLMIESEVFELLKEFFLYPQRISEKIDLLKYKFLKDYFRHYTDLLNIKRLLSLEDKKEFLEGGFISQKIFLKLALKSKEEIAFFFKNTPYVHIVEDGLAYYKKEGTFLYLETLIRNFLIEFIRPQKYNPFGLEPLFAYYLARINELNLIRFILIGKLLNLEKEFLNKGLNNTYV
ncbi:MAG: V-type ATPase subunit [Candidatus Omnitrophica bacterium]|nr:V-type ATPase subunit [Candidatus Omnitrophota bacterium]